MHVAIVGAWPTGEDPPYLDDSVEIWTVGRLAGKLPRITRLYELHTEDVFRTYAKALVRTGLPVYFAWDLPLAEWRDRYGFIANTIAAMLCHAREEGAQVVDIYRSPLLGEPRNEQRESVAYWIGLLRGGGIEVNDRSNMIDWSIAYGAENE